MTDNIKTMKQLQIVLSVDDEDIISSAINFFGEGSHPVADINSLDLFAVDYVIECLTKALANTNETFKPVVQTLFDRIKESNRD